MKLGIENIAAYIPPDRLVIDPSQYDMSPDFLRRTIGISRLSKIGDDETAVSCCLSAMSSFPVETQATIQQECRLLIVVGQTLDTNMPHTSAILHGKLGLRSDCVCFDVSLGCTGFVHGLAIAQAFMKEHRMDHALLLNVELMSRIVDRTDRATGPIFGDGTTATWLTNQPVMELKSSSFGTLGERSAALRCEDGRLFMDGQSVYDFVSRNVPKAIQNLLKEQKLVLDNVDQFIFHQASKRTVDKITECLKLEVKKVPFEMGEYGNLGACSIPVILSSSLLNPALKRILICGFDWGSGISMASRREMTRSTLPSTAAKGLSKAMAAMAPAV